MAVFPTVPEVAAGLLEGKLLRREARVVQLATEQIIGVLAGASRPNGAALQRALKILVDERYFTLAANLGLAAIACGETAALIRRRTVQALIDAKRFAEAATLIDQLSGLGYQTRTSRVTSSTRGTWHQVFVGPYGDLERARVDETRVRQLPGYADAHVIPQ